MDMDYCAISYSYTFTSSFKLLREILMRCFKDVFVVLGPCASETIQI